ncbi:TIGR03085 family metal-binding protein [Brachybacterium horti]
MTPSSDPRPADGAAGPDPRSERAQIADALAQLGPAAPTILPGWGARDLLDHLLLRERFWTLQLGGALPGPAGTALTQRKEAALGLPWEQKVALLREGPGRLSPAGRADALTGDLELLIHHEDLRRAQDGWRPRRITPEVERAAWRGIGVFARLSLRVDARVTLVSPRGGKQVGPRRAEGSLRVHGEVLELLLWVTGRDEVARVQIQGDLAGLAALREGRRGI